MKNYSHFKIVCCLFICTAFLYSNEIFAEKLHVKIEWKNKLDTLPLLDLTKINVLALSKDGNNTLENHFLTKYASKIPVSKVGEATAVLTNLVFKPYTGADFEGKNFITNQFSAKIVTSFYKKSPQGILEIDPIRKNSITGNIELLTECDVEYTINTNTSSSRGGSGSRGFVANSVLSSGNWYKVGIEASGVYKIDFDFLTNVAKIPASDLNFATLGIFGRGGAMLPEKVGDARVDDLKELSIKIVDNNNNGKLEAGDFFVFYAEGSTVWSYDNVSNLFVHSKNLYSSKAFYFITTNRGTRKSFSTQASTVGGTPISSFDDYAFFEDERNNLLKSGKLWYGEKMSNVNNVLTYNFDFSNIDGSEPFKVRSHIAARSVLANTQVSLSINSVNFLTHNVGVVPGTYTADFAANNLATASRNINTSAITATYNFSNPDNSANAWIDYLEINARRQLSFTNKYMLFRNSRNISAGAISKFQLSNAGSNIAVWDITDMFDAKDQQVNLVGSTLEYSLTTPIIREFVAVDMNAISTLSLPSFVEKVNNQDYHAVASSHPDMVIVVSNELSSYATSLANFHQTRDGLSVSVVNTPQLYNEFSGGISDPTAIRDFMKMLYESAGSDPALLPQYLLLYGDASFDPQNGRNQTENSLIPTYESLNSLSPVGSFCSDDFFACLDDVEGADMSSSGNIMDIAVGRLVARSASDAQGINNKIFNYVAPASYGNWRNSVSFIADDGDSETHIADANNVSNNMASRYPVYNIDKIYLDAYRMESTPAGNRYPDVNNAIQNKLFQGSLIVSWVGHGGVQNWAHERIFDVSDIEGLRNFDRLPLFFTATCDFSKFDEEGITTAGEKLLLNSQGGAIGLVTTVRLVYSYANSVLNNAFFNRVFEPYSGRNPTLGELVMETKNTMSDAVNTRKFTLLGDPALTLAYPEFNVVTTELNNQPIAGNIDTMKALKFITIKGEVRDLSNNKMSSFNGTVFPTVFDKKQTITTLGNGTNRPYTFSLQKNAIFKGKATVTNGEFTFSFLVPKDIDYSIGNAKISYYATDNSTDAHGYTFDAYVGGVADSFGADDEGPTLRAFMNDEKFVFGGTTNENPILLVKLFDDNGINTSGTGIGHEITGVLDADEKNKLFLNDFYEGETDNYKKGTVKYPFHNLTEGKHTLEVKAWDTYNNSAKAYTEFIVAKTPKVALSHVLNYPNPFTTSTNFMLEHNRPGEEISIVIQIFSASGKIVKTIHETRQTEGYRIDDIHWDGRDDYGDKIGKGVYIYKVNLKTSEGNAHQFEKLVLLQ
jgi:hypothetical protein